MKLLAAVADWVDEWFGTIVLTMPLSIFLAAFMVVVTAMSSLWPGC